MIHAATLWLSSGASATAGVIGAAAVTVQYTTAGDPSHLYALTGIVAVLSGILWYGSYATRPQDESSTSQPYPSLQVDGGNQNRQDARADDGATINQAGGDINQSTTNQYIYQSLGERDSDANDQPFTWEVVSSDGIQRLPLSSEHYGSIRVTCLRTVRKVSVRISDYTEIVDGYLHELVFPARFLAWSSYDRIAAYGNDHQWIDIPKGDSKIVDIVAINRETGNALIVGADHQDRFRMLRGMAKATITVQSDDDGARLVFVVGLYNSRSIGMGWLAHVVPWTQVEQQWIRRADPCTD